MMKTHRTFDSVRSRSGKLFVSIGIFDGVHRGHREIFRRLLDQARDEGAESAVITFDPHPRQFFNPDSPPRILSSLEEKSAILESLRPITASNGGQVLAQNGSNVISELKARDTYIDSRSFRNLDE